VSAPKTKIEISIRQLFKNDAMLLENDVNERTISGKLAFYLSSQYPELNVDCEYNRKGDEVKRLPAPESSCTSDTKGKTIFPDIIVHKRGKDTANKLVIEIKKDGNDDTDRDIKKLKELTSENGNYNYNYGFHITFFRDLTSKVDVYENGEQVSAESFEISARNPSTN
jgi:hypothetical protein